MRKIDRTDVWKWMRKNEIGGMWEEANASSRDQNICFVYFFRSHTAEKPLHLYHTAQPLDWHDNNMTNTCESSGDQEMGSRDGKSSNSVLSKSRPLSSVKSTRFSTQNEKISLHFPSLFGRQTQPSGAMVGWSEWANEHECSLPLLSSVWALFSLVLRSLNQPASVLRECIPCVSRVERIMG